MSVVLSEQEIKKLQAQKKLLSKLSVLSPRESEAIDKVLATTMRILDRLEEFNNSSNQSEIISAIRSNRSTIDLSQITSLLNSFSKEEKQSFLEMTKQLKIVMDKIARLEEKSKAEQWTFDVNRGPSGFITSVVATKNVLT